MKACRYCQESGRQCGICYQKRWFPDNEEVAKRFGVDLVATAVAELQEWLSE